MKTRLFGLFVVLLAICVLAFGISDLVRLIHGFGGHDVAVVAEPYAASSIFLGVFALALATIALFARPVQSLPRRRGPPTAAERWSGPVLSMSAVCLLSAMLAPVIQSYVVASVASSRGYIRCPAIKWPWHKPDRWALVAAVADCPGGGASPDR